VIRVFLIRHGESESNAGLPSADPESIPLTADGHRQAGRTGLIVGLGSYTPAWDPTGSGSPIRPASRRSRSASGPPGGAV
jgi:hypothetical protein